MRILGFDIVRRKGATAVPIGSSGRWTTIFSDYLLGAWQADSPPPDPQQVLAYDAVFACITQIASDFGSLRPRLMAEDSDGIWTETQSAAFSPVLKKPNRFQNHIQFKEWWLTSKLIRGNAYALKQRDNRGVVTALYLLDASRVTPLVADDGSVFYRLQQDNIAGLEGDLVVPASEIIHDRMNCLFHPLVGLSPLYACALSALQGLRIQEGSSKFFGNNSAPGGVLTAPGSISDPTAKRLKDHWDTNYTGSNAGKVAVLGDGLKFEPMRMTAVESQLIDQINMTAARVCACFHVPASIVGFGNEPVYANGETPQDRYYNRCLRTHIEHFEAALDEGLGLDTAKDGIQYRTELDLEGLLRLDTATQTATLKLAVEGAIMAPNEARKAMNLSPLEGGNTVYMQQQNYSLEALAKRDSGDPFAAPPAPMLPATDEPPVDDDIGKRLEAMFLRSQQVAEQKASEAFEATRALIDRMESKSVPVVLEATPDESAAEFTAALLARFAEAECG